MKHVGKVIHEWHPRGMKKVLAGILAGVISAHIVSGANAIKELLQVPTEQISAACCSDDEFLTRYATAVRADMEDYVAAMAEVLSIEQQTQLREAAEQLIATANDAYRVSCSLRPISEESTHNTPTNRDILRSRLLHELRLLHATGSPWCSGSEMDSQHTPPKLPAIDQQLWDQMSGSTTADIALAEHLLRYHREQLKIRRCLIRQIAEDFGHNDSAADFDTAEQAWERYFSAICHAYLPVINHHTGGSGTPVNAMQAQIQLALSQQQRLNDLTTLYRQPRTDSALIDSQLMSDEETEKHLTEIIRQSSYTPVQRQELYNKAHGIEKLLRTPVDQRDYYHNLWSDDEFFRRYADALQQDMEHFVAKELRSDYYIDQFGREQSAKDAAECNRLVHDLIHHAQEAYQASLKWFENELTIFGYQFDSTQELHPQFRIALQNRLLTDLFRLGQNDMNRWAGCIVENTARGSALRESFPQQFAAAISARGYSSTPGFAESQYRICQQQLKALHHYRDYILRELYNIDEDKQKNCDSLLYKLCHMATGKVANSPRAYYHETTDYRKAAELFHRAEHAWEKYMTTLEAIVYPIDNSYFDGSGIGGWCHEFKNHLLDSHNSYLLYLIHFAGDGNFPYSDPIDFTEYELTEEAAKALNQLPG